MALITAEAKLYNGIRLLCVDVNAQGTLSASLLMRGSYDVDTDTFAPNIENKILRLAESDFTAGTFTLNLVDERYLTYGFASEMEASSASLECKFPTYIRFDLEALGVPDGTEIILQLEEGFLLEGDYVGSNGSPLAKVNNLLQFITPTKATANLTATFSVTYDEIELTTPFEAVINAQVAPFVVTANLSPAGAFIFPSVSASLSMTANADFVLQPTTINSEAAINIPIDPTLSHGRLRFGASDMVEDSSAMVTDNVRARIAEIDMVSTFTMDIIGDKFKGFVDTFESTSSLSSIAVKKTDSDINLTDALTFNASISANRVGEIVSSITSAMSVEATQIVASVRWRQSSLIGTIGTGLFANDGITKAMVINYSTGAYRLYIRSSGSMSLDDTGSTGFTNINKNLIGLDENQSIIAVTSGAGSTSWEIQSIVYGTTTTVNDEAYMLSVAKDGNIVTYDGTNNKYRLYNATGSELTYSNTGSTATPYTIATGDNSSLGFRMFIAADNSNNLIIWNNQGAATKQTVSLTGLSSTTRISLADNGETFAVSTPSNKKVYIYGRSGTANNTTTLLQTITGTATGYGETISLGADGQHLLIGKEYWIRSGNTFSRWRDVDYFNGDYTSEISLGIDSADSSIEAVNVRSGDLILYRYY